MAVVVVLLYAFKSVSLAFYYYSIIVKLSFSVPNLKNIGVVRWACVKIWRIKKELGN